MIEQLEHKIGMTRTSHIAKHIAIISAVCTCLATLSACGPAPTDSRDREPRDTPRVSAPTKSLAPSSRAANPSRSASNSQTPATKKSADTTIPPMGFRLSGVVTDENDTPTTGARVELMAWNLHDRAGASTDRVSVVATCDTTGRYALTSDSLPMNPAIRAVVDGYLPKWFPSHAVVLLAGKSTTHNFRLERASEITGLVVDAQRRPVARARVVAVPFGNLGIIPGHKTHVATESRADGTFRLTPLHPGPANVGASRAGAFSGSTAITAPATSVTLVLDSRKTIRVEGRVRDFATGAPVADTSVTLHLDNPFLSRDATDQPYSQRTSADGTFAFPHYPVGVPIVALAHHPNLVMLESTTDDEANKQLPAGGTARVDVVMYPGHTVTGQVTNAITRAPIPGAVVRASMYGANATIPNVVPTATSDADGRFTLTGVAKSAIGLSAEAPGFRESPRTRREPMQLTTATLTATQNITLLPLVKLAGRVVRDDGVGAEGAEFRLLSSVDTDTPIGYTRTAPGGWFEADVVPETQAMIVARAPGFGPGKTDPVQIGDSTTTGLLVKLTKPATIGGIALLPDKSPAAGATIRIAARRYLGNRRIDDGYGAATTNNIGQFLIRELPSDTSLYLSAQYPDFPSPTPLRVTLKPEEQKFDVELLFCKPFEIAGVFLTDSGEPIPNAPVNARPSANTGNDTPPQMAHTDGQGRFRIKELNDGTYNLTGTSTGFESAEQSNVAAGRSDVRLILKDNTVPVEIRLLSGITKQPVTDAEVKVTGLDDFTQDPQDASVYRGKTRAPQFITLSGKSPTAGRCTSGESIEIGDKPLRKLTFYFRPAMTVTGRVVTSTGGGSQIPVPNTKLLLRATYSIYGSSEHRVLSGPDGRFVMKDVEFTGVDLEVHPPAPLTSVRHFTMPTDFAELLDVGDIVVSSGVTVDVKVVDADGTPQTDKLVTLSLRNLNVGLMQKRTESNGVARFENVAIGAFTAYCENSIENAYVDGSGPIDLRIIIGQAKLIVRQNVPEGVKPNGAYGVSTHEASGQSNIATVGRVAEATVEFSNMLSGRHTVKASVTGPHNLRFEQTFPVDIAAGETKEISITHQAATIAGRVLRGGVGEANATVDINITRPGFSTNGTLRTDPEGRFTFRAPTGTAQLAARANDGTMGAADAVTLRANETANIEIELATATGAIRSTTVDYATGRPILSAPMVVQRNGLTVRRLFDGRDADGTILADKLPVGPYQVLVGDENMHTQAKHNVVVEAGKTVELTDVLQITGAFIWMLRSNQTSAANVEATLTPLDPASLQPPRSSATNGQNSVTFGGLLPGTYRAEAQTTTGLRATLTVEIQPGQYSTQASELR